MAGRLLAAMAPSFVFRHVGGRHGGARAQPLFGNAMQILVIEDDARVAEHIAKGLKTAGHGVALGSDARDRKRGVSGKRASVRVDLGGRRLMKKKKPHNSESSNKS